MIFIPLPFVVALLLVLLFIGVAHRNSEHPANLAFLALIALAAMQSALIGLRFGYGVEWLRFLSPLIASVMAPVVYFGSLHLAKPHPYASTLAIAPHGIPLLLVSLSMLAWPITLDAIIVGTFIVYAVLLLLLLRSGEDSLRLVTLEGVGTVHRALVFAALVLLFSAAVDTVITFDIAFMDARHVPQLVSVGNVATLLFLSIAGAVASRGRAPEDHTPLPVRTQPEPEAPDDPAIMDKIEELMTQTRIYRDTDLNLDRLARRLVTPARQISGAINRTTGKNVSQYVNDFRISEACDQLRSGTKSVTEIMFDAGFQTKSNFNREFRRVTGMTPLEWRKAKGLPQDSET